MIQSSGLFEPPGLAHGGAGFLEQYAQPLESWQLRIGQRPQKIRISSNMPMEFFNNTSLNFRPVRAIWTDGFRRYALFIRNNKRRGRGETPNIEGCSLGLCRVSECMI